MHEGACWLHIDRSENQSASLRPRDSDPESESPSGQAFARVLRDETDSIGFAWAYRKRKTKPVLNVSTLAFGMGVGDPKMLLLIVVTEP